MMVGRARRLFNWKDLRRLLWVSSGYILTSFWPRRLDRWLLDRLMRVFDRLGGSYVERLAAVMEWLLAPAGCRRDWIETARQNYYMRLEDGWGRVRDLHRRGWEPSIAVEGLEHVHQGLVAGRGVILWGMMFCGLTLSKAAFSRLGLPLVHLSREGHGSPSTSWLGRHLDALGCRPENRYLAKRIIIPADDSLGFMRELTEALQGNACVSIYGENRGRQNVVTPFFGVRGYFATGAPSVAWKLGSSLLTYYVMREDVFRYRMVIEPLTPDRGLGRQAFVTPAIQQFAQRLEQRIRERPADWHSWWTAEWWHQRRDRLGDILREPLSTAGATTVQPPRSRLE
jgi:lauroyl/myristoyl acyltransferase